MDYKTFCEEADIELYVELYINGERKVLLSAYDIDGLEEQLHKLDIQKELDRVYQDLPEPIEDDYPEEEQGFYNNDPNEER
jgi:hypothetical protein